MKQKVTQIRSKSFIFLPPVSTRCWKASKNGLEPPKSIPKTALNFFGGSWPEKVNFLGPNFGLKNEAKSSLGGPLRHSGAQGAAGALRGAILMAFWLHFGSLLAPCWCDFGMILHAPLFPFLALLLPPLALLVFVCSPALLVFLLRFWMFLCHLWASALRSRALALRLPGLRFAVLGFSSGVFVF